MATPEEPDGVFDRCASELEADGYALLPLNTLLHRDGGTAAIARAFDAARCALDAVAHHEDAAPLIDPSSDSGRWTGYHSAAVANGRYNQHREGFVFSNGEMFDVSPNGAPDGCNFEHEMSSLFHLMHNQVADKVLRAIERRLELRSQYFQREVGPTNDASQWHMKRYVIDGESAASNTACGEQQNAPQQIGDVAAGPERQKSTQKEADILLPVHTDPSLISVVILDRAGTKEGGMGLEVFHPSNGTYAENAPNGRQSKGCWREVSHHGHDVAIIFVGSVLSYLTKGQNGSLFSAAKHRVVNCSSVDSNGRMATTLFVRPNPDALMKRLPSPRMQTDDVQNNPPTFWAWNARVAKNYMKKKQRGKSNKKG